MVAREVVRQLMETTGIGVAKTARLLGYRRYQSIQNRLQVKSMSVDNFIELLSAFDYELVAQPKTAGNRKEGAFLVEFNPDSRSKPRDEK